MARRQAAGIRYAVAELDGVRYALLPERVLIRFCREAGIDALAATPNGPAAETVLSDVDFDRERLAKRLALRRRRAGLTQVELARRAGIRVETLNRVERGKTTPDFSTVRKIVVAIDSVEAGVEAEHGLK